MYCDLWSQYIQVRKLFKGGNYSRVETIHGNMVIENENSSYKVATFFRKVTMYLKNRGDDYKVEKVSHLCRLIKQLFWWIKCLITKTEPTMGSDESLLKVFWGWMRQSVWNTKDFHQTLRFEIAMLYKKFLFSSELSHVIHLNSMNSKSIVTT